MKFKLFKSKKLIITAIMTMLTTLTLGVFAASTPVPPGGSRLESTTGVLNATRHETTYKNSTSARVDDVVNIQVWYHNTELENSGKNANNVNVRISLPGTKTTNHIIASTVGGTNTNIITNNAYVTTSIPTNIQYIPGTAQRRYNTGTNANPNWVVQTISDSVVGSGYTIPTMRPCWNFQESIIVQARLMAPTLSILKQVKVEGSPEWQANVDAQAGDTLAYLITVKNEGNTQLNNLIVRDSLPPRLQYVTGSAMLYNANHRSGIRISDSIIAGGVNAGNYTPGSDVKIRFQARIPADQNGCNITFRNIAASRADGLGEYWNEASARTSCRPLEARLRIVKYNDANGNRTQDPSESNLSGWQFRVTGPNNFSQVVTTDSTGQYMINGLAAGNYVITEVLQDGWINTTGITLERNVSIGETESAIFGNRRIIEEPPVTPPTGGGETTLPVSGPAETAGAAAASMTLSGGVLAWLRSKKNLLSALKK